MEYSQIIYTPEKLNIFLMENYSKFVPFSEEWYKEEILENGINIRLWKI